MVGCELRIFVVVAVGDIGHILDVGKLGLWFGFLKSFGKRIFFRIAFVFSNELSVGFCLLSLGFSKLDLLLFLTQKRRKLFSERTKLQPSDYFAREEHDVHAEVQPEHYDNDGGKRAVNRGVVSKILDKDGEEESEKKPAYGGDKSAEHGKFEFNLSL